MKKNYYFAMSVLLIVLGTSLTAIGQTNKATLQQIAVEKAASFKKMKAEALVYAKANDIPVFIETDGVFMELMFIDKDGQPQYYITENNSSSATISTNRVNPGGGAGLNLDGGGMNVHEWDGGAVRASHQEFGSRVTQVDNVTTTHYHATHVGGTMIASGVTGSAKGMAPAANLRAYDWNNDESEMATAGANGALVSNHSYGYANGWSWTGSSWVWYGSTTISTDEDYAFGFYDTQSKDWDIIAKNAPYYLIVKSAGNDRGDGPTSGTYPQDGPYDCIGNAGNAKNILTVGAVNDIAGGYSQPSDVIMSSFSSWGPVDDGRIKPDICTNGVSLYSTDDDNDTDYTTLSGTSMAAPSATGSLILLQEHYQDLNGAGNLMLAATLKALVVHTADEAGPDPGPDYMFGWGLMNTESAAAKITEDQTNNVIEELTLNNGESYTRTVTALGGQPLVVTIVWTDIEGTPIAAALDPPNPMIVNELDIRITEGANTYYPWSCDRINHSAAATRSAENNVDNVEMVTIDSPSAGVDYTVVVDHDGSLSGGSQAFSIVISGIGTGTAQPIVANFGASTTSVTIGETVTFTDLSTNGPTSWNWTFAGGTPATSTYQNPIVTYNTPGTYSVSLTAANAQSSDTKTVNDYITVASCTNCNITYSNTSDDYITKVVFNSINNSSASTHYSDFTSISTDAEQNSTYTLSVDVTVNGSWVQHTWAWFDWNGNCDFTDSGEAFDLGATPGTSGTHTLTVEVSVPADANLGSTRLRVAEHYNSDPTSCQSSTYGEAEDYSINITEGGGVNPPACATVVSPVDGGVDIVINTNLEWAAVADADGYKLYFGTDNPPTDIENGTDLGDVTSYNPASDLDNNSTYYWKVVAYNTGGDASGCSTWSFVTEAVVVNPPTCATALSPVDGSIDVAINANLEWNAVADADGYKLNFGSDNPPTDIENGVDVGNVTSYNPASDLDNNLTYYWKVVPYNTGGDASGCQTWSFVTEAVIVPPPVANFTASTTTINIGESVTFTDQSTNGPSSWNWTFAGGTPATSTNQNPVVTYNTPGTYTVSLTVTNAQGSDTKTETDFITVASCTYCNITYSNTSDDYITKVVFNGINNSSASTHYSDFTSISTDAGQNSTYTLSVDVTVNGSWVQHTWAWFDWNGNCDFTDPGEAFDLGATPGTSGTHTLTVAVSVPADANLGSTRMRVAEHYNSDPTSCQSSTYGEAEDYSINIIEGGGVYPPACASAATPVNGGVDIAINTNLEWTAVADADGYKLYFGSDNPPTDIENGIDLGDVTSYNPASDLDNNSTYYWKIIAYNTGGDASGCSTWSFTTVAASSGSTELSYTDFEGGWDIWTDGGGDCSRRYTSYSPQGNYSADIQDNSGVSSSFYHTNGVDVHSSGYIQIDVDFTFQAISMDNSNEDFWVQYYDGSSWFTVGDFNYSIDFQNNSIYAATVSIMESDYTFPTNMKIRFMCDASGNRDDIYVDEIRITASDQVMNSTNGLELISEATMPVVNSDEMRDDIVVYPNPVSGTFLTVSSPYVMKSIMVYNMMGELIEVVKPGEQLIYNINTVKLTKGLYLLRIEGDDDVEIIRFIKQ